MNRFALLPLCLAAMNHAFADETREPPLVFRVEIDGKNHSVAEGDALKIGATLMNPTVRIHVEPHREFRRGDTRFRYPRGYSFEADVEDPANKTWTFSGNDFTVMYFVIRPAVTVEQFAESLRSEVAAKRSHVGKTSTRLGGRDVSGVRLDAEILNSKLRYEIFPLRADQDGKETELLVFMDTQEELGKRTKDAAAAIDMIQKSIKWK